MGAMLLVLVRRRQASRPWGAPTKPPPTNLPTPFVFVSAWCVMACVRRVRGLFVWRERSLTPFCPVLPAPKQNPAIDRILIRARLYREKSNRSLGFHV